MDLLSYTRIIKWTHSNRLAETHSTIKNGYHKILLDVIVKWLCLTLDGWGSMILTYPVCFIWWPSVTCFTSLFKWAGNGSFDKNNSIKFQCHLSVVPLARNTTYKESKIFLAIVKWNYPKGIMRKSYNILIKIFKRACIPFPFSGCEIGYMVKIAGVSEGGRGFWSCSLCFNIIFDFGLIAILNLKRIFISDAFFPDILWLFFIKRWTSNWDNDSTGHKNPRHENKTSRHIESQSINMNNSEGGGLKFQHCLCPSISAARSLLYTENKWYHDYFSNLNAPGAV